MSQELNSDFSNKISAAKDIAIPQYFPTVNKFVDKFIAAIVDVHTSDSGINAACDELFKEISSRSLNPDLTARLCNDILICISSRLISDFCDNRLFSDFLLKEFQPNSISSESTSVEMKASFSGILLHFHQIMLNSISASSTILGTVNYLLKTQCDKVTLQYVADYLNISASYLSLIFKEKADCNFRTYVHKYRMQKASQYLLSSNMTINQIAIPLGYNDVVNFSRIFKKYYSLSPSDYRLVKIPDSD